MALTAQQKEIIRKCKSSVHWFLKNFGCVKHPAAGIIPFKPFKYQLKAIRSFRENRFNIFKKCRQCFAGDMTIWGPDGPKRIRDMRPGDLVYTLDQNTCKFVNVAVEAVYENGIRECVRVTTANGKSIIATADHNFFTPEGPIVASELLGKDLVTCALCIRMGQDAVVSVEPAGKHTVYDIKVPPHDNYVVEGAVVHNSGISTIAGAFALWYAMFHDNKTILIVSRRNEDAMSFLRNNILFLYNNLPKWMRDVWKADPTKHEVSFINGSIIKSMTSHPEVLRSNASSLNIIDEAAFIQDMNTMWAAGYPTLQHGGSVIVISTCVVPGTYIVTNRGMVKIGALAPSKYPHYDAESGYSYADCSHLVMDETGKLREATQYYYREPELTYKIRTNLGYELEASTRHKMQCLLNKTLGHVYVQEIHDQYVKDASKIYIPIYRGKSLFGRDDIINGIVITPELAYIIGLVISKGTIFDTFIEVGGDKPLHGDWVLVGKLWRSCDAELITQLKAVGVSDKTTHIPELFLQCSKPVLIGLLRGLCRIQAGKPVDFTLEHAELSKQVQLVLLNVGIITRRAFERPPHADDNCWWIAPLAGELQAFHQLLGVDATNFSGTSYRYDDDIVPTIRHVAVDLLRKCGSEPGLHYPQIKRVAYSNTCLRTDMQQFLQTCIGLNPECVEFEEYKRLTELIDPGLWWCKVKSCESGLSEVVDFTIPDYHTFWSDGFNSHNTNGVGNWYWNTWTDAEAGLNDFSPILINWWDMDWVVEFDDALTRKKVRICPTDDIRECKTKEEIDKYGPYVSPWLIDQYRALQEKGEGWRFQQEVLASFIGSGNTVLDKSVLAHIVNTVDDNYEKVTGLCSYLHPISGETIEVDYDFEGPEEGLLIWDKPIVDVPPTLDRHGKVLIPAQYGHKYAMGVDLASGKAQDYQAIVILDLVTMRQVAEFMARCLPREIVYIIDRLGRWYNNAVAVVESNNGGHAIIDDLRYNVHYPKLYRKRDINDKPRAPGSKSVRPMKASPYGFATSVASKPLLNKLLTDCIRDSEDQGYTILSRRLLKQLDIYVRKRDRSGNDTGKTEAEDGPGNHDDLVMALMLALVGATDHLAITSSSILVPVGIQSDYTTVVGPNLMSSEEVLDAQNQMTQTGGKHLLLPMGGETEEPMDVSVQRYLDKFTYELGAVPMVGNRPIVANPKFYFNRSSKKKK